MNSFFLNEKSNIEFLNLILMKKRAYDVMSNFVHLCFLYLFLDIFIYRKELTIYLKYSNIFKIKI